MREPPTSGATNLMAGLMIAKVSHVLIRRRTPMVKLNGNFPLLVGPAGLTLVLLAAFQQYLLNVAWSNIFTPFRSLFATMASSVLMKYTNGVNPTYPPMAFFPFISPQM